MPKYADAGPTAILHHTLRFGPDTFLHPSTILVLLAGYTWSCYTRLEESFRLGKPALKVQRFALSFSRIMQKTKYYAVKVRKNLRTIVHYHDQPR